MENFSDLVSFFIGIIGLLIPLIFAVTLVFIIWKAIDTWVIHGGESGKIEEGRKFIIVGVIVLVFMSSIWGILALLKSSLFVPF